MTTQPSEGGKPKGKKTSGAPLSNGHDEEYPWDEHAKKLATGYRVKEESGLLVNANDLADENIDWVWRHRLARGALHLIAGIAGSGKSTLAFTLAAAISSGGKFPDGTDAPLGKVVIWSGEDSYATTIKPRMRAAGANFDNVLLLTGQRDGDKRTAFDPSEHMQQLARELEGREDIAMIVIDPIVSAIKGDSHKNAEVRRDLQPLVDLLEAHGIVGIGITHYTKGTAGKHVVERVTGSLAFAAIARMIFATVAVQGEPGKYRLVVGKTNIAPLGGGFEYTIKACEVQAGDKLIETTRIEWGETLQGEPMELIAQAEGVQRGRPSKTARAEALISTLLANGACRVSDIEAAAEKADISMDTLRRVAKSMGVKFGPVDPANNRSPWQWSM